MILDDLKKGNNYLGKDNESIEEENMYIFNFNEETYQYNNLFDEINYHRKKSEYIDNILKKATEFEQEWKYMAYQKKVQICSETDKLFNDGASYWNSGDYDKAIRYATKALKIKPDNDDAIAMLGAYYKREEDYDIAIGLYKIAIKLTPIPDNKSRYYVNIGNIYFELGERSQGVSCYQEAANLGHTGVQEWLMKNGFSW
jgi:tetratricopeptide (TPR) repeat protein